MAKERKPLTQDQKDKRNAAARAKRADERKDRQALFPCGPGVKRGKTGRCLKPCKAGQERNAHNRCQVAADKQRGPRGKYKPRNSMGNLNVAQPARKRLKKGPGN